MGPNLKIDGDLVEDFVGKMKLTDDCRNSQNEDGENQRREEKHEGRGGEDDGEEEEFTFDCVGASNSFSISAEDIFHNGQIRPVFPLFDQSLLFRDGDVNKASAALRPPLRKLFVKEEGRVSSLSSSEEPEGPYCAWAGKAVEATPAPDACKKSNSTGFSKLRRFRELVLRSNSDGKDAFVFLHSHNNNPPPVATENAKTSKAPGKKKWEGAGKVAAGKKGKKKEETALSVHEKLYGRKKKSDKAMKGAENRRRSYLPYRQDLVGFFTSSNGLSKNVHPY